MKKVLFLLLSISIFAEVNVVKCTGCHGPHFEKHAMGTSRIVKDLNSSEIYNSLIKYRDGNKTSKFSGIMKFQVKDYNNAQIKDISTKIGKNYAKAIR